MYCVQACCTLQNSRRPLPLTTVQGDVSSIFLHMCARPRFCALSGARVMDRFDAGVQRRRSVGTSATAASTAEIDAHRRGARRRGKRMHIGGARLARSASIRTAPAGSASCPHRRPDTRRRVVFLLSLAQLLSDTLARSCALGTCTTEPCLALLGNQRPSAHPLRDRADAGG